MTDFDLAALTQPDATAIAPTDPIPAVPRPTRRDHIDAILQAWVNNHIFNSPVSRSVDAINHVQASLPALADLIDKEI